MPRPATTPRSLGSELEAPGPPAERPARVAEAAAAAAQKPPTEPSPDLHALLPDLPDLDLPDSLSDPLSDPMPRPSSGTASPQRRSPGSTASMSRPLRTARSLFIKRIRQLGGAGDGTDMEVIQAGTTSLGRKSLGGFESREAAATAVRGQLQMLHDHKSTAHWSYSWWEPKDMDFAELTAKKYGKSVRWQNLECHQQIDIIRENLKPGCTLNPNGKYMRRWELLLGLCLLMTSFLTPYDVAFLQNDVPQALNIISRVCDLVFFKDLMMQFVLQRETETHGKPTKVRDVRVIAWCYLKSWFLVDIISLIPYNQFGNDALDKFKAFRLLRLVRLFKLARIRRASKLVKHWQNRIGIMTAKMHLMELCFLVIIVSHWIACFWGFVGSFFGSRLLCRNSNPDDPHWDSHPSSTWFVDLPDLGTVDPYDPTAFEGLTWLSKWAETRTVGTPTDPCSPSMMYGISLYWAVMTITSIGYGDILPVTPLEYVLTCMGMLFGSLFWAYTIGTACSIISSINPERAAFEQNIDDFNRMADYQSLPRPLRIRGRQYLREARAHETVKRHQEILQSLGHSLRGSIANHLSAHYLDRVWYLRGSSQIFGQDAANAFVPHFFERREEVEIFGNLCVVERGLIARRGVILTRWKCWGEDVVVRLPTLRVNLISIALIFTEVLALSRQGLHRIAEGHPEMRRRLKCAAVLLALQSAYRIYSDDKALGTVSPHCGWIHELFGRSRMGTKISFHRRIDELQREQDHRAWQYDIIAKEDEMHHMPLFHHSTLSVDSRLADLQVQLDKMATMLERQQPVWLEAAGSRSEAALPAVGPP